MTKTVDAQGPVDVEVRLEPAAWLCGGTVYASKICDSINGLPLTPLYAIPEGWALVPKKPTPEMLKASLHSEGRAWQIYTWMVGAAPLPPNVVVTGSGATKVEK